MTAIHTFVLSTQHQIKSHIGVLTNKFKRLTWAPGHNEATAPGFSVCTRIINGDFINYSEGLSKRTNLFISIIIYFILITLFMKMHESFVFIKVFSQSFGVLFLAMINIIIMSSTSLYIDLTAAIGVMFFAPEIVELIEEISEKYNLYEVTTKLKSNIYSFLLSIKNK